MKKLVCYTRLPISEAEYAPKLAYSMHLGYETENGFKPLNHNTGVLFVKATQDPETKVLFAKSLKCPRVLPISDGTFLIAAIRTLPEGEDDESSKGSIVLFKSSDLVHYTELGLKKICDGFISDIELKICKNCGLVTVKAEYDGKVIRARFDDNLEICELGECHKLNVEKTEADIEGFVSGNVFEVSDDVFDYVTKKLLTPYNTAIELPKTLNAQSKEELEVLRAVAHYSDGSTALKRIDWDFSGVDFNTAGEYEISGKLHQDHFDFPITDNRADPMIYHRDGYFYFIATNDADWNHTLYVRKAKTIPELVSADEHLILDTNTYPHVKGLLWAPEFHEVGGKLYIFHACTTGEFGNEHAHVMAYNGKGDLTDKDSWDMPKKCEKPDGSPIYTGGITLDMTTFDVGDETYAAWSQRQFSPCDLGAWVYISRIDRNEPWKLLDEPVCITVPEYGWQNNHTFVDEGPFAIIKDEKIYLTFSSALVDSTYCVGMLTANVGDDLLDPRSWQKTNYPLLHSHCVKGEYGVGHNAYVVDQYGDTWNTYHGRPGIDGPRSSGIRRVHFGFDGEPILDMTEELDLNPDLRDVKIKITVK